MIYFNNLTNRLKHSQLEKGDVKYKENICLDLMQLVDYQRLSKYHFSHYTTYFILQQR